MKQQLSIYVILFLITSLISSTCKADTLDNYQIYIGKKLWFTETTATQPLSPDNFLKLDSSNRFEILNINFSHCAPGASGRKIKLTDSSEKTIMLWEFGDKAQEPLMSIQIKDILSNKELVKGELLKIYYVDDEYPEWRFLAFIKAEPLISDRVYSFNSNLIRFFYVAAVLVVISIVLKFVHNRVNKERQ